MVDTDQNSSAPLIRSVTVYAGSGANVAGIYREHAFELGKKKEGLTTNEKLIAEEGWVQVNGGGRTGLMGASSEGAKSVGGVVDSVNLRHFVGENEHLLFRERFIFDTLPERKKGLYDRGDAYIALPGGLGTLDELVEVSCMRQLCFHQKPVVAINTKGYFNGLKQFVDHAIKEKFVTKSMNQGIYFAENPKQAIDFLKNYKPVIIDKSTIHSGEMDAKAPHQ